jgi:hypothetical protein
MFVSGCTLYNHFFVLHATSIFYSVLVVLRSKNLDISALVCTRRYASLFLLTDPYIFFVCSVVINLQVVLESIDVCNRTTIPITENQSGMLGRYTQKNLFVYSIGSDAPVHWSREAFFKESANPSDEPHFYLKINISSYSVKRMHYNLSRK